MTGYCGAEESIVNPGACDKLEAQAKEEQEQADGNEMVELPGAHDADDNPDDVSSDSSDSDVAFVDDDEGAEQNDEGDTASAAQAEEEEDEEPPEPTDRQRKLLAFMQHMTEMRLKISERQEANDAEQQKAAQSSQPSDALEVPSKGEHTGESGTITLERNEGGGDSGHTCQESPQCPSEHADASSSSVGGPSAMDERLTQMRRMKAMLEGLEQAGNVHDDVDQQAYTSYCSAAEKADEGDFVGAVDDYTDMLRANPDDVDILLRRGKCFLSLNDYDKGINDMTEALRRNADRADIWFARGTARSDSGDDEGAFGDFEESLRLDASRPEVWCCRGTSRLVAGDPRGAAEDCAKAIALDEEYSGAWGLRGMARLQLGDNAGAVEDCERALDLDPELEWVRPALLQAQATLEHPTAAAQLHDRLGPEAPAEPATHRERGNALFKSGDLRGAVAAYREAHRSQEEGYILALSNQAICYLKLEEYSRALVATNVCLRSSDAPYKVRFTKFKALCALNDWSAAFATMDELKALPGLPADVLAAAEKEERAKHAEYEKSQEAAGEK